MIKKFLNPIILISIVTIFSLPTKSFAISDPTTYNGTGGTPGTISGGVVTAALGCTDAYGTISDKIGDLFGGGDDTSALSDGATASGSKDGKASTSGIDSSVPTKDGELRDDSAAIKKKEECLDSIAYAAAKVTLQAMTQNIVNWIGSGFEGDSLFIKNPKSFFKSIADQEVYSFVTELNDPDKYPWGPEVGEMISSGYENGNFEDTAVFDLDEEIGEDWEDFFEDFDVGGWDGWIAATQNTANNPVSFQIEASKELNSRVNDRLDEVNKELTWGNGFLSVKQCVEYDDASGFNAGGGYIPGDYFEGADYSPTEGEYTLGGLEIDNCKRYEITTPGNAISEQLNITLGSGIRQAELADELNESLASIVDALTNQLIYEGVSALQNASVDTEQTGGYGTNSGFYDGTFDTASGFTWDPYAPVDLEIVVPENIASLNEYVVTLTQARDFIQNEMLPTLKTIDVLMPEPDYGWEARMQQVYSDRVAAIYAASDYEKFQNGVDVFYSTITLGLLTPLVELDDAKFAERKAEAAAAEGEAYERESLRIPWDIANHNLPGANIFREQRDKIGTYSELLGAYQSTISEMNGLLGKLNYITENLCDETLEPDCDNTSLQYVYATVVPYLPDDEANGSALADYETFQVEHSYANSLIPTIYSELALVPFGGIVEPSVGPIWGINGSWGLIPPIKMPMTNGQYDDLSWEQRKAIDYADGLSGMDLLGDYVNAAIFGAFDPDENIYVYAGVVYTSSGAANNAYNTNLSIVSANIISPTQNPYSPFYPLPNPPKNPFSTYQILEGADSVCADYDCDSGLGQEIYSNLSSLAKSIYEESGSMDTEDDEVRRMQLNPFIKAYTNPNY